MPQKFIHCYYFVYPLQILLVAAIIFAVKIISLLAGSNASRNYSLFDESEGGEDLIKNL